MITTSRSPDLKASESNMITTDQVPLWGISRGIAHAIANREGDYATTACGSWGNMVREFVEGPPVPSRVCRRCREALKDATLLVSQSREPS